MDWLSRGQASEFTIARVCQARTSCGFLNYSLNLSTPRRRISELPWREISPVDVPALFATWVSWV